MKDYYPTTHTHTHTHTQTVLSLLVGGWWGPGIALSFTHCMRKKNVYIGCLKIDATHLYENSYCIKSFLIQVFKKSYHFWKVKQDDKGRNRFILFYSARKRLSSCERLWRKFFAFHPTEFLTAFTLSGHPAINFQSDLGFSAFLWRCLLILWHEICVHNNRSSFYVDNC